jgi:hypothetical protein
LQKPDLRKVPCPEWISVMSKQSLATCQNGAVFYTTEPINYASAVLFGSKHWHRCQGSIHGWFAHAASSF